MGSALCGDECEHCGHSVGPGRPHSTDECLARLRAQFRQTYDERGRAVNLVEVQKSLLFQNARADHVREALAEMDEEAGQPPV